MTTSTLTIQCPSCSASIADGTSCTGCGLSLARSERGGRTLRGITRARTPVNLNLVVGIDRTGSSEPFRQGISTLLAAVLDDGATRLAGLKVTLATHGDLDDGQQLVLMADRKTPEEAVEAARSIRYGGGGDPAETHLDAVEELLATIPWTAGGIGARDALLLITTAESKLPRSGRSPRAIGEALKARGILLFLVSELTPRLFELVQGASGVAIPISNAPTPDEVRVVAAKLAESIQATASAGSTIPMAAQII